MEKNPKINKRTPTFIPESRVVEVVQMKNSLMTNNYMSINDLSCKMQCRILTSIGMKLKKRISFLTT